MLLLEKKAKMIFEQVTLKIDLVIHVHVACLCAEEAGKDVRCILYIFCHTFMYIFVICTSVLLFDCSLQCSPARWDIWPGMYVSQEIHSVCHGRDGE